MKSAVQMKYTIVGEMKSTLLPLRQISSTKWISSSKMISPTRKGGFH